MTALKNYPKEFIERTIDLLDKLEVTAKEHDLEVTFFLNLLLGTIVSINENYSLIESKIEKKHNIFNKKLNDIPELKNLLPNKIITIPNNYIKRQIGEKFNDFELLKNYTSENFEIIINFQSQTRELILKNYSLKWLLEKLRNGVAHQNLTPRNDKGEWKGVRITNITPDGLKNFAIELSISQLKGLTHFLCEKYLEILKTNS